MGKANRPRPNRIGEKLLIIRQRINGGLSQNEMLKYLGLEDDLERDRISKYERNTLEPPIMVLLSYAKAANVYLEVIVDDKLDLPDHIPAVKKSEGIQSAN
jgi:transcriptional regulator with XRE-family HTH domain